MVNKSGKNKNGKNSIKNQLVENSEETFDEFLSKPVTFLPKDSGQKLVKHVVDTTPDIRDPLLKINKEYLERVKLTENFPERENLIKEYFNEINRVFDKYLKPYRVLKRKIPPKIHTYDTTYETDNISPDIFSNPQLFKKISKKYDVVHPLHPTAGLKYISDLKTCQFCGRLIEKRNRYCGYRCELDALNLRRAAKKVK